MSAGSEGPEALPAGGIALVTDVYFASGFCCPAHTIPRMSSRSLFLYWPAGSDVERDEVEEIIEEALRADGEVTGGGAGTGVVNLDVEIYDGEQSDHVFRRVHEVVARVGLPIGAYWKWEYSDTPISVQAAFDS